MVVLGPAGGQHKHRNSIGHVVATDLPTALVGCYTGMFDEHFLHLTNWSTCCHHEQGMPNTPLTLLYIGSVEAISSGIRTVISNLTRKADLPERILHNLISISWEKSPWFLQFTGVGPLCDVLMGYMFPGFPIANVCFRMYSAESIAQGLAFLRDFKLGHYMKIPPRAMLAVQVCQFNAYLVLNKALTACLSKLCQIILYPHS